MLPSGMEKAVRIAIGSLASSALADLEPIPGLPRILYDTESGLDWLHLSETQGLSYNQILASTQPSGEFEGWHVANSGQLGVLFTHGGMNFGGGSLRRQNRIVRRARCLPSRR